MAHTDVSIVVATRAQPCEHCKRDVEPGTRIAFYSQKPRGVAHIECHAARRGKPTHWLRRAVNLGGYKEFHALQRGMDRAARVFRMLKA